ncbi:endonuclease [Aquibacillus albus]|uniref:Homing endonuclease LAGLIDADG domain-containing protein n=1 Tax=Aquibacillus albus TaxID=1168171 RepID=A0ABS2MWJ2_9BACI|nr:endonuclease [Aquibacillus albus]MBM7570237.1 hypothetical protein [Aquibacillus albus]
MGYFENYQPVMISKIIGKLLGDGSITVQQSRKPRFQFSHTITDLDWTIHCYNELKYYLPLNKPKYRRITDSRIKQGYSESYIVQSKTHNVITLLEKIWYKNRNKVIPFDLLDVHFNTVSLAWWYQDDGSLKIDNGVPRKIILSTDSFTKTENLQLIDFLLNMYKIKFSIDNQNRLVLYSASEIFYFLYLVKPFIQPCMIRKKLKIKVADTSPSQIDKKRTTIYLPSEIRVISPTKEINHKLEKLQHIWDLYKQDLFYPKVYFKLIDNHNENVNIHVSPYQIIITKSNFQLLYLLKKYTGLTYSELTLLCFIL